MATCLIDDEGTVVFRRQLENLREKYQSVDTDLAEAYAEITKNYAVACHASTVGNRGMLVWRYRFGSTDMNRGNRGGFRLMAIYRTEINTMFPFCIHSKTQFEFPDDKQLKKWIKSAIAEKGFAA